MIRRYKDRGREICTQGEAMFELRLADKNLPKTLKLVVTGKGENNLGMLLGRFLWTCDDILSPPTRPEVAGVTSPKTLLKWVLHGGQDLKKILFFCGGD